MPPAHESLPRGRSPFAAAFLSLLFPGLGHAYLGAYRDLVDAFVTRSFPLTPLDSVGVAALQAFVAELHAGGGVVTGFDQPRPEFVNALPQPDSQETPTAANRRRTGNGVHQGWKRRNDDRGVGSNPRCMMFVLVRL
jgi:hypothetical protein